MRTSDTIYVAGHRGLAGSAIWRGLEKQGYSHLVGFSSDELDLTERTKVFDALASIKPDVVIDAAARVGGIHANSTYPAEFLSQNLQIQTNLMDASHSSGVERLLFLGSSCVYPKLAPQPIVESSLLTGALEQTNDAYAIAKIAGILQVQAFRRQYGRRWISVMPTNLYGPGDNFHPENSHVIPALMRRFHEAVERGDQVVTIWGSGSPMREFLHVDDMAAASVHVMQLPHEVYAAHTQPMLSHINVGTGVDCTIRELAETIARVTGFGGRLVWDSSKPDGTPRKLMDVSRLAALGWNARIGLEDGLRDAYQWFLAHHAEARL
jgi:GDP-L-fucose synthase